MNGLLSMIGMQTELDYQIDDFPFSIPHVKPNTQKFVHLLTNRNVSQRYNMSSQ